MAKILVVDDHKDFADTTRDWLQSERHAVDVAYSAREALDYIASFEYDVILLDWSMPEMSGYELCKRYRANGGGAYVVMLTGLTATDSKIQGLDAGADDYVTKPVDFGELLSRVRALLRRPVSLRGDVLKAGELVLDSRKRVVTKSGVKLDLKPLEFSVLSFFMEHPNEVVSTQTLLQRVWKSDAEPSIDSVYSCVNRLRKKLDNTDHEALIKTVYGVGYRFEA